VNSTSGHKVSIITVCYNSEKYIRTAIDSVLSQDYPDIEYIIIDGKSADKTMQIIGEYGNKISLVISEPDNGIYDAMNKGLKLATGDIVATLNSDDMYASNTIISQVVNLFEQSCCNIVYGDLDFVATDDTDKVVRTWITKPFEPGSFKHGWHPPHPTFFVKKEIYQQFGYFNTRYSLAADFELMLRFLEKHQVASSYLPVSMVKMRIGGASGVASSFLKRNLEVIQSFKMNKFKISIFYPIYRLMPKILSIFKNKVKNIIQNFS